MLIEFNSGYTFAYVVPLSKNYHDFYPPFILYIYISFFYDNIIINIINNKYLFVINYFIKIYNKNKKMNFLILKKNKFR
jgi:hypothetical protein